MYEFAEEPLSEVLSTQAQGSIDPRLLESDNSQRQESQHLAQGCSVAFNSDDEDEEEDDDDDDVPHRPTVGRKRLPTLSVALDLGKIDSITKGRSALAAMNLPPQRKWTRVKQFQAHLAKIIAAHKKPHDLWFIPHFHEEGYFIVDHEDYDGTAMDISSMDFKFACIGAPATAATVKKRPATSNSQETTPKKARTRASTAQQTMETHNSAMTDEQTMETYNSAMAEEHVTQLEPHQDINLMTAESHGSHVPASLKKTIMMATPVVQTFLQNPTKDSLSSLATLPDFITSVSAALNTHLAAKPIQIDRSEISTLVNEVVTEKWNDLSTELVKRAEARAEVIVNKNWAQVIQELNAKKHEMNELIRSARPSNQRIEEILEDTPPRRFVFSAQSATPQAGTKLFAAPTTPAVKTTVAPVVPTVPTTDITVNSGPVSLTSFPTRSQEKDLDRACIYLRETTGCDYRTQGVTRIRVYPTTNPGDAPSRGEALAPDLIQKAVQDSKSYVPGSGAYANLEFTSNHPGQLLVNPGSAGGFPSYANNNNYDSYPNYNNNQDGQFYGNNQSGFYGNNNNSNRGRGRGQGQGRGGGGRNFLF
ncbi:hypothetical protein BJ508DRAFT_321955 [Ascobolus immersus RN42]|uniref:Uncharacterized protein n=1 Tax=Ascobolus immersus RN42 TaxID=1160509 RepID=A0A3N4IPX5_ASCIM|nr:hypothetical protein BJ508DRAFT_321955 [Ascobolus immersus RN42]